MNFPLPSPLSPSRLIQGRGRGWHQVDYSVKVVLFTLKGLKVKVSGFRVKFIEVREGFDGCDKLKIIFKSRKNKVTKFSFILNMIKILIIKFWFVVEKNLICINENKIMY